MSTSQMLFEKGLVLNGLLDDHKVIPRILHWNDDRVWLGDVGFAYPGQGVKTIYARAPWTMDRAELEALIDQGQVSCTKVEEPENWRRPKVGDEVGLEGPKPLRRRRNYAKWEKVAKQRQGLIEPLIKEFDGDIGRMLEAGVYATWPVLRQRELNRKSSAAVYDALHRYLIGLGSHALVPAYQHLGGPGRARVMKSTGKKTFQDAYLTTARCRRKLQSLYRKHATVGVPIRIAYARALAEGWCTSRKILSNGDVDITLRKKVPSIDQFIRWGRTDPDAPSRKHQEQRKTGMRNPKNLHGNQKLPSGPRLGVKLQIDSTGSDQTLVSEASSLLILPAPWETRVEEPIIRYTYGQYIGFESPSALTTLLAILHAADDKREYCERYRVKLKSANHWIPMEGNRFVADRGEGNNKETMFALEEIEGSLIYAPSYFPEAKAAVESGHRRNHAHYGHLQPASTRGLQAQRGTRNPEKDACVMPYDYIRGAIEQILWFNNDEYVEPQFIEMKRDGVGPSRREQVLWCKDKGYVGSRLSSIESLRIRCLPKLLASIGLDGIRVFDPSRPNEKALLDLTFTSSELKEARMLASRRKEVWVRVDPSTISHVWLDGRQLIKVPLSTRDPLLHRLTWADVIHIAHDKNLAHYFYRSKNLPADVSRVATLDQRHVIAKAAKRAEQAQANAQPKSRTPRETKKDSLHKEIGYMPPEQVVLHDSKTGAPTLFAFGPRALPASAADPFETFLDQMTRGKQ
jgi:hypothetical protein